MSQVQRGNLRLCLLFLLCALCKCEYLCAIGQKTTLWCQFSPINFTGVLEIELGSLGFAEPVFFPNEPSWHPPSITLLKTISDNDGSGLSIAQGPNKNEVQSCLRRECTIYIPYLPAWGWFRTSSKYLFLLFAQNTLGQKRHHFPLDHENLNLISMYCIMPNLLWI